MKNRTAQVPFPIVQSEMFLPIVKPISPYFRKWENRYGDRCIVQAPQSLNHYDLVTFLVFLHVIQQSKDVSIADSTEYRYEIEMPLSLMYMPLGLKSTHQRRDMIESLKKLSKTSLEIQYKEPCKHDDCCELVLTSLTGDLKVTGQRGRIGSVLKACPLRGLVDDRMLTLDVDRMIALEQPLSRIAAFFVSCRPKNGIALSWNEWMNCISTGSSVKRFKQRFRIALKELQQFGFDVEERDAGKTLLVRRP